METATAEHSLRPIGEEFWYEFLEDDRSTTWQQERFLYRVVAHVPIVTWPFMAAEVTPIRRQIRNITGWAHSGPIWGDWEES